MSEKISQKEQQVFKCIVGSVGLRLFHVLLCLGIGFQSSVPVLPVPCIACSMLCSSATLLLFGMLCSSATLLGSIGVAVRAWHIAVLWKIVVSA
jgi:hypothetical protein